MVISKETKRKRKETSPMPPPMIPVAVVESSPEMPKRTKVQAQRKFALGQNVPNSSTTNYGNSGLSLNTNSGAGSAAAAGSGGGGGGGGAGVSSTTTNNNTPSTSSESREPPTEILPNKRPKTEDFLTFLCFRGTSTLPDHLNFLKQCHNEKGNDDKNGGANATDETPTTTTTTTTTTTAEIEIEDKNMNNNKKSKRNMRKNDNNNKQQQQQQQITAKTAKRGRPKKTTTTTTTTTSTDLQEDEKIIENENTVSMIPFAVRKRAEVVTDGNRRAVRENKMENVQNNNNNNNNNVSNHNDDDNDDETKEDTTTPTKETVTTTKKTNKNVVNKIPTKNNNNNRNKASENNNNNNKQKTTTTTTVEANPPISTSVAITVERKMKEKKNTKLKETPIFIPTTKTSGRMTRQRAFFEPVKVDSTTTTTTTTTPTTTTTTNNVENKKQKKQDLLENSMKRNKIEEKSTNAAAASSSSSNDLLQANKSNLHVFDFSSEDEQPLAKAIRLQTTTTATTNNNNKKSKNVKKLEKKLEIEEKQENEVEVETLAEIDVDSSQQLQQNKSQRPTRKTKEAAAIYMDIIHHKLQISEDEDDNCSLNSYPDLPNVRETEKMEIQLKKNVGAQKLTKTITSTTTTTGTVTRRGRPPKVQKMVEEEKIIENDIKKVELVDDEDFLLNEEVNETKRKLEKNFSDSDDEPLAIKANTTKTTTTKPQLETEFKKSASMEKSLDEQKQQVVQQTPSTPTQQQQQQERGAGMKFLNLSGIYGLNTTTTTQQPAPPPPLPLPTSTVTTSNNNTQLISQFNKMNSPSSHYMQKMPPPAPTSHYIMPQTAQQGPHLRHSLAPAHMLASPVHSYTHQYAHQPLHAYVPHLGQHPAHMHHMHHHHHGNVMMSPHMPNMTSTSTNNERGGSINVVAQQAQQKTFDVYPSPKINPNFLTPKFDRTCLPTTTRGTAAAATSTTTPITSTNVNNNNNICTTTKNTTHYSPVKYENVPPVVATSTAANNCATATTSTNNSNAKLNLMQTTTTTTVATTTTTAVSNSNVQQQIPLPSQQITATTTLISCSTTPTTTTAAAVAQVANINYAVVAGAGTSSSSVDPLKEEICSILAANLMPSKEESTKIFGIASVSLAQSSGPDNTKCTLGKCGSIHKPVLGPVVPTEGYFGDQLSSKERRKAKVNMTHEQIQKWLIECSSNPDDIHDDLEDDFDENLRPNLYVVSPPPNTTTTTTTTTHLNANGAGSSTTQTTTTSQVSKTPNTTCTVTVNLIANKTNNTLSDAENKMPPSASENVINEGCNSIMSAEKSSLLAKEPALNESPTTSRQASKRNSNGSILNSPKAAINTPKVEENNSKLSKSSSTPDGKQRVPVYKKTDAVQTAAGKTDDKDKRFGGAFSVDNEKSIYSFDKDLESADTKQQPTLRQRQQAKEQANLGGGNKVKEEQEKSDADTTHTFYIPLQDTEESGNGGGGGGKVKGVAVQLGHEGADGPNKKFTMHAALVTRDQIKQNINDTETTKDDADKTSKSFKKDTQEFDKTSTSTVKSKAGNTNSTTAAAASTANNNAAKKFKDDIAPKMANNTAFPRHDDPTQMVEAPIFRPTEKEFVDPMDFIERITPIAARFGICKIIPPATFKPECRISDEMRFTAYNQYVHKMLHRWGPSAKELSAIKKYLTTQNIQMSHQPWIGGMEVDLPRLYHTVQELGGLKEVIEKKKWARVAEEMCIPKLAQDRVTKLDDIYCKYLLPYDTLLPAERQKLFDEVEADWAKREARARRNADRFTNMDSVSNDEDEISSEEDDESDEENDGVSMECIVKGRSMPLSQFYRIARNTMALWFKNTDPTVNEIEAEFWRHVAVRDSHVCVHSGSIDSSGWGYGFPSPGPKGKGSNYGRHPWNLKVLTNNPGSVLRSLGPVMGVTVPTLHVGMLFSACCWYRDPHGLSWIEYLHTGASKLWYGIPYDQSANFRSALTSLIPTHCQNKTIWLPCDTVMVPPHMLTDRGVSLCRIEQKPGEFIVVFPRAFTSSVATGYVVSESVYFATSSWLESAHEDFRDMHESCEPAMFSLEQLLFALGMDQRVSADTLKQMLPMLKEVWEKEAAAREQLKATGVTSNEKIHSGKGSRSKKQQQAPFKSIESECDLCRASLYISMVKTDEGNVYCLQHALKNLNNGNIQAKQCKLIYAYNVDDIKNLIKGLQARIEQKRSTPGNKKGK